MNEFLSNSSEWRKCVCMKYQNRVIDMAEWQIEVKTHYASARVQIIEIYFQYYMTIKWRESEIE